MHRKGTYTAIFVTSAVCSAEAPELGMNVEARREQVMFSSDSTWHLFGLECPLRPLQVAHRLAGHSYGFHFNCKYPGGYTTCQKTMLRSPFVRLKAL